MAYSDVLVSQKNSLLHLNSSISNVSATLNRAIGKLELSDTNINQCFSINDERSDNREISQCLSELRRIINDCSSCAQTLNKEVVNLDSNIRYQRKKEADERKKNE